MESDPMIPDIFISHAHYDHSRGFQFPSQVKRSTKETAEIYEADSSRKVGNWMPVRFGRRLRIGEVEIEAHDAGHVLGAAQYEIITSESNLVYASHINFMDTSLTRAAEVAPCDLLVLETGFSSSETLPPRESTIGQIVTWALDCIKERRIPALVTDPIGLAQELVRIFNTWTELPVIVHPRIARINKVYESNGVALRYADASIAESQSLIEDARSVVIVPRGFDASHFGDFRTATVSGRVTLGNDSGEKAFRLSDQADFNQLLRFVQEARPKTVLTFRGASRVFANMVSRRLGIAASELAADLSRPKPERPKIDDRRVAKCQEAILKFMQIPDFTYGKQDLLGLGMKEGYKSPETEEALLRLVKTGVLTYSELVDGYRFA